MNTLFNSPDYTSVVYKLNIETGRYEKQPNRVPFEKLPFELRIEKTWDNRIINNGANEIITGRIKGGNRQFFTGLIPVSSIKNLFVGNDYSVKNGVKKNSLVVFNLSEDNKELYIYYFNSFYKDSPKERMIFVLAFIQSLRKNK